MRDRGLSTTAALAAAACVALALLLALVLGRGHEAGPAAAVELVGGVPVGVQHTPAGALAAADNYVALASQSIEQDPAVFAALVAEVYAPETRTQTLEQAQRIRDGDAQNMDNYEQGGRAVAIVAARRLDRYTPDQAHVTSWLGGFVWGPRLTPRQTWNLVQTTLRWGDGRWFVVSSNTSATPAPVPSIVYVNGANNQSSAFARLHGMSAPFYGAAG
ncbi:MAG TPA: hypothetical protein VID29_03720 [Solirubrobacteraceae bacterium]|jgi:hypothetical protein